MVSMVNNVNVYVYLPFVSVANCVMQIIIIDIEYFMTIYSRCIYKDFASLLYINLNNKNDYSRLLY